PELRAGNGSRFGDPIGVQDQDVSDVERDLGFERDRGDVPLLAEPDAGGRDGVDMTVASYDDEVLVGAAEHELRLASSIVQKRERDVLADPEPAMNVLVD